MQTLSDAEIAARAKELVHACPSQITCAFGCGTRASRGTGCPRRVSSPPSKSGIEDSGSWKGVGLRRFEKYGLVNSYENQNYQSAVKDKDGHPMILHQFRAGAKYQGPDGKIWWIPVVEVFDLRAFEWKDGKYVGTMTEIDPNSDYAKAMVEVQ